jgi:hypothetical protein
MAGPAAAAGWRQVAAVPRRHDERVDVVSLPCLSPVESVVMRDTPTDYCPQPVDNPVGKGVGEGGQRVTRRGIPGYLAASRSLGIFPAR